jgi:hypothetical protein
MESEMKARYISNIETEKVRARRRIGHCSYDYDEG